MEKFVSYCQSVGHSIIVDAFSRQNVSRIGGESKYGSVSSQYGSDSSRYELDRAKPSHNSRNASNASRKGLETLRSAREWYQVGHSRIFQRPRDVYADRSTQVPQDDVESIQVNT